MLPEDIFFRVSCCSAEQVSRERDIEGIRAKINLLSGQLFFTDKAITFVFVCAKFIHRHIETFISPFLVHFSLACTLLLAE